MPTQKKRLNISLSREMEQLLEILAERDNIPQATKAVHLMQLALEIEEDDVLDLLAAERDERGVSFVSHEDAWK